MLYVETFHGHNDNDCSKAFLDIDRQYIQIRLYFFKSTLKINDSCSIFHSYNIQMHAFFIAKMCPDNSIEFLELSSKPNVIFYIKLLRSFTWIGRQLFLQISFTVFSMIVSRLNNDTEYPFLQQFRKHWTFKTVIHNIDIQSRHVIYGVMFIILAVFNVIPLMMDIFRHVSRFPCIWPKLDRLQGFKPTVDTIR